MGDIAASIFPIVIVAVVVVTVLLAVRSNARSAAAALEAKRKAAENVVQLLAHVSVATHRDKALSALRAELAKPPLGFIPELVGPTGIFARSAPTLTVLMRDADSVGIVEWYFSFFTFPAGRQREVLAWLGALLDDESHGTPMLRRIAERAVAHGGPAEAEWFYQRTLETLRRRAADPELKTLVLQAGRLSYASGRVGRKPAVYDELAIANDMAAST